MKCQILFSLKNNNKKIKMLSAANLLSKGKVHMAINKIACSFFMKSVHICIFENNQSCLEPDKTSRLVS